MTFAQKLRLKLLVIMDAGFILLALCAKSKTSMLTSITLSAAAIGTDGSNYVAGATISAWTNAPADPLAVPEVTVKRKDTVTNLTVQLRDNSGNLCGIWWSDSSASMMVRPGTWRQTAWFIGCPYGASFTVLNTNFDANPSVWFACTNLGLVYPAPLLSPVVHVYCGGVEFFRATNPPGCRFFKSYPATNSNWVSISDSPDLTNWNSAFALLNTTGRDLTITQTP